MRLHPFFVHCAHVRVPRGSSFSGQWLLHIEDKAERVLDVQTDTQVRLCIPSPSLHSFAAPPPSLVLLLPPPLVPASLDKLPLPPLLSACVVLRLYAADSHFQARGWRAALMDPYLGGANQDCLCTLRSHAAHDLFARCVAGLVHLHHFWVCLCV
jgi:hypothetical protein